MTSAEKIIEEIKKVPNGCYVRVGYKTTTKLAKEFKDTNNIEKLVITSFRTGVAYKNISKVKEALEAKKDQPKRKYTCNWHWLEGLENKIKYNEKTEKYYLTVATVDESHSNTEKVYFVNGVMKEHLDDEDIKMLPPKKENSKPYEEPPVKDISFDNIISINGCAI